MGSVPCCFCDLGGGKFRTGQYQAIFLAGRRSEHCPLKIRARNFGCGRCYAKTSDIIAGPGDARSALDRPVAPHAVFSYGGQFLYKFGRNGTKPGDFDAPPGLWLEPGNGLYVADMKNKRVRRVR